jgi:hypothetical protein
MCSQPALTASDRLSVWKGLMRGSKVVAKRRFLLVLIKPSHYGDDGYVIRWWRSMIPSNSLASLYGIAADSAARGVLGAEIDIDIEAIDEFNARVDIARLLRQFSRNENFGLVVLVGRFTQIDG